MNLFCLVSEVQRKVNTLEYDSRKTSQMNSFIQRCIEPDCQAEYKIDERLYVCSRCGGLLDVVSLNDALDAAALRELWRERKSSLDVRDRSGVWRFREFL